MKIIHALLSTALLTGIFTTSAIAAPSDNAPSTAEKSWTHTGSIGFAAPVSKFKTGGKDVGTVGFEIAYFESEKNEYKHEELGKVDKYFTETLGGRDVQLLTERLKKNPPSFSGGIFYNRN